MSELRGVVFSPQSLLMIHSGQKTQTRRAVKQLKVRLLKAVPGLCGTTRARGQSRGVHSARICDGGAIVVSTTEGELGVEPGECNLWAPWIRHGTTALSDVGGGKQVWTVIPYAQARVRVLEVWRTHERPADSVDGILFAVGNAFVPIENTSDAADRWVAVHNNGKHKEQWRSPIYLPGWASRTVLDIHMARLMRLHDLAKEDALAEGVMHTDYGQHEHRLSADGGKTWGVARTPKAGWSYGPSMSSGACLGSPVMAYANAWNRIHGGPRWNLKDGPEPWAENPWVWAYTFSRVT